jgi:hypothetical protein
MVIINDTELWLELVHDIQLLKLFYDPFCHFISTKKLCVFLLRNGSIVLTIMCYVSEPRRSWSEFHHLPSPLLAPNVGQIYVQDTQVRLQSHTGSNLKLPKRGLPPLKGIPPSRIPGAFKCPGCGKSYWYKKTMLRHLRLECGKEPQFQCPYCPHRAKQKNHLVKHIASRHKDAVQELG